MRTSTSKYLANEGGSLPQGTWTKDENILMIVLIKLCNLIEVVWVRAQSFFYAYPLTTLLQLWAQSFFHAYPLAFLKPF